MEFDLFTFVAQLVNFLVLVALLRIFLYKRVVQAMDQREEKIRNRLEDARRKEEEAENEAQEFRRQREDLQEKKDQLISEARDEAGRKREELVAEARDEVRELRKRWMESLRDEQEDFSNTLGSRAADTISEVVRRLVHDLADADLESQILHTFANRLAEDESAESELSAGIRSQQGRVRITSSFAVSDEDRNRLVDALSQIADTELQPDFQETEDIACGIEVIAGDRKAAWTVDSYVESLRISVEDMLTQELQRAESSNE